MTMVSPLAAVLSELERLVEGVSPADIPALIGNLERLKALAWARLTTPKGSGQAPKEPRQPDHLLSAEEAANALGVKKRWLYDHAAKIPGCQRLSRRCLRFSERKLRRFIEARTT